MTLQLTDASSAEHPTSKTPELDNAVQFLRDIIMHKAVSVPSFENAMGSIITR
jgi:hypothetical protein